MGSGRTAVGKPSTNGLACYACSAITNARIKPPIRWSIPPPRACDGAGRPSTNSKHNTVLADFSPIQVGAGLPLRQATPTEKHDRQRRLTTHRPDPPCRHRLKPTPAGCQTRWKRVRRLLGMHALCHPEAYGEEWRLKPRLQRAQIPTCVGMTGRRATAIYGAYANREGNTACWMVGVGH